MNPIELVLKVANRLVRKTYWYNNILFPDCAKFSSRKFNLEVVNLGSTSAKYAFDYNNVKISAANWATSPQSFVNDYAVLSNYSSFLKENACVIISVCPFSCLGGGNDYFPDRFYSFIRPISIPNFSLVKRDEVRRKMNNPIMYYPLIAPFYAFRTERHTMTSSEMEQDAAARMKSWLREFSIYDLNEEFSLINSDRYNDSVLAARKLLTFCMDHGYCPILVLPPMSKYLSAFFNPGARKQYMSHFIDDINISGNTVLNYLDDTQFQDDRLFRNSFLLNKNGAKLFTERVLNDINKSVV